MVDDADKGRSKSTHRLAVESRRGEWVQPLVEAPPGGRSIAGLDAADTQVGDRYPSAQHQRRGIAVVKLKGQRRRVPDAVSRGELADYMIIL